MCSSFLQIVSLPNSSILPQTIYKLETNKHMEKAQELNAANTRTPPSRMEAVPCESRSARRPTTTPSRPRAPPTCPSSRQRALAAPAPLSPQLPAAGRRGEPAVSAMRERLGLRQRESAERRPCGAGTGRAKAWERGSGAPSLLMAAARCLRVRRICCTARRSVGVRARLKTGLPRVRNPAV